MLAFAHPDEALHAPRFFLMRGAVRANLEVPDRAASLRAGLAEAGVAVEVPSLPDLDALATVHAPDYLAFLRDVARDWAALDGAAEEAVANLHPTPEMLAHGARPAPHPVARLGWYTADTACPVGPGTWGAALSAAGCALAAARRVAERGGAAYALCRPPGHHAYPVRAGGHCYLNNAALAAEALRAAGAARVAVVDVDSHHGNGTQGVFWERGDVLVASVHGDPSGYYPWYVGHAGERGAGPGEGANLNLPLPLGTGEDAWLEALGAALSAVRAFRAEALVVSLGFDAWEGEPLRAFGVTREGFARAGAALAALGLPSAVVQEGGYAVDALGCLLAAFLRGWGDGARSSSAAA